MNEPGTRRPCRCEPGVTMSTWRALLPLAENGDTMSSAMAGVPNESLAPTAIRKGSREGLPRFPDDPPTKPSLPADATTKMPARHACSVAKVSGSIVGSCVELVP